MLEARGIEAGYGEVQALFGVSFAVAAGEILCLMGRNGAGKTTSLRAVMGLAALRGGEILLGGEPIHALPAHRRPGLGLGYVPQGRRLFGEMTVAENIEIGLMTRSSPRATREKVLEMFPRLRERLGQRADTLSGGEQQMLATARALSLRPSVLLLDEPTEGLQPSMIALIREAVSAMKAEGVAVVLVEQRAEAVLEIADRVCFIENGRTAETIQAAALRADDTLIHRYVGV